MLSARSSFGVLVLPLGRQAGRRASGSQGMGHEAEVRDSKRWCVCV